MSEEQKKPMTDHDLREWEAVSFHRMAEALERLTKSKLQIAGFICLYCGHKSPSPDEAVKHDGTCAEHPAVKRLAELTVKNALTVPLIANLVSVATEAWEDPNEGTSGDLCERLGDAVMAIAAGEAQDMTRIEWLTMMEACLKSADRQIELLTTGNLAHGRGALLGTIRTLSRSVKEAAPLTVADAFTVPLIADLFQVATEVFDFHGSASEQCERLGDVLTAIAVAKRQP